MDDPDGLVVTWHRHETIVRKANDYEFSARGWISLLDVNADRASPDFEEPSREVAGRDCAPGCQHLALDIAPAESVTGQVKAVTRRYDCNPSACH